MVPTLTCGFVRSNFCLAMGGSLISFLGSYFDPASTISLAIDCGTSS